MSDAPRPDWYLDPEADGTDRGWGGTAWGPRKAVACMEARRRAARDLQEEQRWQEEIERELDAENQRGAAKKKDRRKQPLGLRKSTLTAGHTVLPGLRELVAVIPHELPPEVVQRRMTTNLARLNIDGRGTDPVYWLLNGGDRRRDVRLLKTFQ